jgi:tripartite-type tricarboxylate transporter receptor subunit TctC
MTVTANNKNMGRRCLALTLLSALGLAVFSGPALAQDKYPSKPIRILVPYAPGGATDIVARALGDQLKNILGQAIVVDNRPGAFGIIAIEEMARAAPDGHTLMLGNVTTNAITPVLHASKFSIKYDQDVVPVARLVDIPAFLVVTTRNFEPKTLAEFVDYAKKNKGRVRYGHVGVGSYPHYDGEVFARRAGIEMLAIPNKAGASGILKDLGTGDVQMAFINVASSAGLLKSGQIRALAAVNPTRLASYPDVPTFAELGYKDVGTVAWQGLFAPAKTPQAVLDTLNAAILKAMENPQLREIFARQLFNIVPTKSSDEARKWLADEIASWRKITDEVKLDLGN